MSVDENKQRCMVAGVGLALLFVGVSCFDWRAGVIAVGVLLILDTITWRK